MTEKLIIYTDGASRGNPGPGGYGAVLIWGQKRKELSQGYRRTTNNRMELMAVIASLKALTKTGLNIVVHSDSSYVVNAVEKRWLQSWLRIDFKGKKNADLWKEYHRLSVAHNIKLVWVKGHADNVMNNRCDALATAAADNGPWLVDQGFEYEEQNPVFG
ncbi:ribonuclease HI [Rurimicrobium arvi]|uniref:ribonuclease H n=1 Tax=Rurimicrobium arvi TaxID=2049916 RepID=A0ABP8MU46_9BACT